jgi:hypothetical protein
MRLAQWLAYRIKIYDDSGRVLWWGRVSDVEIHTGGDISAVNLQNTWNKIAVQYQLLATGESGVGLSTLTAYNSDAVSVATYGTRELIVQGTNIGTQAAAEAKRDQLLAYYAYPRVERTGSGNPADNYAIIRCTSELDTLAWKFYANSGTAAVATTTQLTAIYAAANQYLAGVYIQTPSGIDTNQFRDGQQRALDEIRQLLEIGTTAGRRLLIDVDEHRRLRVYGEPARGSADWRIDAQGDVTDNYGVRQMPHTCPGVGKWLLYQQDYIGTTGAATLADPGVFFCERAEYNAINGSLSLTPRGAFNPFELVRIGMG